MFIFHSEVLTSLMSSVLILHYNKYLSKLIRLNDYNLCKSLSTFSRDAAKKIVVLQYQQILDTGSVRKIRKNLEKRSSNIEFFINIFLQKNMILKTPSHNFPKYLDFFFLCTLEQFSNAVSKSKHFFSLNQLKKKLMKSTFI